MDRMSKRKRSRLMKSIGTRDTAPELSVRSVLREIGVTGYRTNVKSLPGTPDIVIRKLKLAIFVNGCFWHQHKGCHDATKPTTNTAFWREKFRKNLARDNKALCDLRALGWRTWVVWGCETKDRDSLKGNVGAVIDLASARKPDVIGPIHFKER